MTDTPQWSKAHATPLLTWLYVPGDRPERFEKAVASGADAVIIDLEDAVALSHKRAARAATAEYLTQVPPVPVYVRVNALTGPEVAADVAAVAGLPGLTGLRLPKVQAPQQIRELVAVLAGLTDRAMALYCLIESALGVEAAYQIAAAHPTVVGIGLGEADLSADLNVTSEPGLTWPRSRVVVASRAAGLPPPAMSVYPHVSDLEGLTESCRAGRGLGFLGRAAIHPRQLPVIAEAFRPGEAEVDKARAVIEAVTGAQRRDSGTVVLADGSFADVAMIAAASRTLALADRASR